MANLIELITVTDAVMTDTNVLEDDGTTWAAGTTYAAGDTVIYPGAHEVYESASAANTGHDPTDGDLAWWIPLGSTNRWRAFDQKTGQSTTKTGILTYELTCPSTCTALALFALGAVSVRVWIEEPSGEVVYDETQGLVDTASVISWFSYFTYAPEYATDALFVDIPGYAGSKINIEIDGGGGDASVGEIGVGRLHRLGVTLEGVTGKSVRLSTVDRALDGSVSIVERAGYSSDRIPVAVTVGDELRVRRILKRIGSTPTVYFADADMIGRVPPIYGLIADDAYAYDRSNASNFELNMEGMI